MGKRAEITKVCQYVILIVLALLLVVFCPSFPIVHAQTESTVWHAESGMYTGLCLKNYGSNMSSLSFNENISQDALVSFNIAEYLEMGSPLNVTYNAFSYKFRFQTRYSGSTAFKVRQPVSLSNNVDVYIVDNLGNKYLLDSENGGSFIIEDTSNITKLSLYYIGNVSGRISLSGETAQYLKIEGFIDPFDITLSVEGKANTITDSNGTVWTVPEGVENPVVLNQGYGNAVLVDGISDLYYLKESGEQLYHFASFSACDVWLYNPDGSKFSQGSESTPISVRYLHQGYTLPVFVSAFPFEGFLYGSLPDILEQTDVQPVEPVVSDDRTEYLESVRTEFRSDINPYSDLIRYSTEKSDPENNWFTTWDEESKGYEFYTSEHTLETTGEDGLYHSHIDEYVSFPLIFYTSSRAPYNGNCVVSFPKGLVFNQPEDVTVVSGSEYLKYYDINVEITPYLLVQGVRYEISEFACTLSFPVYEEEPFSFTIGYEAHIRANVTGSVPATVRFRCPFEISRHAVSVWYYSDKQELSQIQDILENYPDADKMDDATSNLDNAFTDYNDVQDSMFKTAEKSISDFDITSGLKFGGGLLSAITFLSTLLAEIIIKMQDFSMLYTVGICLIVAGILLGLWKFWGGSGS